MNIGPLDIEPQNNVFHTEDLLFELYSHLGLKEMAIARQISSFHRNYFDNQHQVKLFNTTQILVAEQYIRANDRSSEILTLFPEAQRNFVSISPSENSQTELLIKFKSKWIDMDTNAPLSTNERTYPIASLFSLFSGGLKDKADTLCVEYVSLTTRKERGHFIDTYKALNPSMALPRWHFLKIQSEASLKRLKDSLGRYQSLSYKTLRSDVDKAMTHLKKNHRD